MLRGRLASERAGTTAPATGRYLGLLLAGSRACVGARGSAASPAAVHSLVSLSSTVHHCYGETTEVLSEKRLVDMQTVGRQIDDVGYAYTFSNTIIK